MCRIARCWAHFCKRPTNCFTVHCCSRTVDSTRLFNDCTKVASLVTYNGFLPCVGLVTYAREKAVAVQCSGPDKLASFPDSLSFSTNLGFLRTFPMPRSHIAAQTLALPAPGFRRSWRPEPPRTSADVNSSLQCLHIKPVRFPSSNLVFVLQISSSGHGDTVSRRQCTCVSIECTNNLKFRK